MLNEKHLQPEAVGNLRRAGLWLELARRAHLRHVRNLFIHSAIRSLEDARADMVESG